MTDKLRRIAGESTGAALSVGEADLELGRLAVSHGLVTARLLEEAFAEQRRQHDAGERPRPLADLLLRVGLPLEKLVDLLRAQGRSALICGKCGGVNASSAGSASVLCLRCGGDVEASDPATTSDRKLGKYVLIREVARGGMGVVYEAEDPDLKRRVALKILKDERLDEDSIRRLHREAAIAARLAHPNIISIHEVGSFRGPEGLVHYIAMDFIEGRTFADVLQDSKVPRPERVRMLEEIARAVGFAHRQGVVHRDLKPGNVLVDRGGRVILTDFGLARAETFLTRLTATAEVIGTPQYMAPEQVIGDRARVGPRTDVYALGVILYEILTGRMPFDAPQAAAIFHGIIYEEPGPLSGGDRELQIVCLKAMDKDPRRRYADAADLAEDLRRWRDGEPILARRPSWAHRAWRKIRRRPSLAAVAIVAVAAVLIGGLYVRRREQGRAWLVEADDRFRRGDVLGAKELYDRARDRVKIPEDRYQECARRLDEQRRRAEDDLFVGPVLERIARLSDTRDGWARAIELLDEALASRPGSWRAWMERGSRNEWLERPDDALEDYRKALESNPRVGTAHYLRGRILIESKGRKEEALAEFRRALEVEPGNEFALLGQARIAGIEGRYDDVLKLCAEAEPAGRHLEDLSYVRGMARLHRNGPGDLEEAVKDLTAYLERRRTSSALASRGLAYHRLGRGTEALADLDEAVRLNPRSALALTYRGIAREGKGDLVRAIEDYTAAIAIEPGFTDAWVNRGVARQLRGDLDGAISDYTECLRLDPQYDDAYVNRGSAWFEKGKAERAILDFTMALTIDATRDDAWRNRGLARVRLGDRDGAIADFSQSIRLRPTAEAYMDRGSAHLEMDDLDAAEADFSQAIKLDATRGDAWYNRGLARHHRGDSAAAIEDYTQAIKLSPTDYDARFNRALVRHQLKEFKAAIEDYTEAISLRPRAPEAWFNRGCARHANGDAEGGAADLDKALEVAPPDWPDRRRVEDLLQKFRRKRL